MKRTFIIFSALLVFGLLMAKEHSIDATGIKKIEINNVSGKLTVVGISGNSVSITGEAPESIFGHDEPAPEKAKGLRELNAPADNTGLGLVTKKDGSTLRIESSFPLSEGGEFLIKVPSGLDIEIVRPPFGGSLSVSKISGELTITSVMGEVELKDITGPLTLSSVNGNANISFSKLSQEGPTTLSVVNGDLDIYLPATTPANLELSAVMGRIFTDFDVQEKESKPEKSHGLDMLAGSSVLDGKINGGGAKLILSNVSGSIYIRKK